MAGHVMWKPYEFLVMKASTTGEKNIYEPMNDDSAHALRCKIIAGNNSITTQHPRRLPAAFGVSYFDIARLSGALISLPSRVASVTWSHAASSCD
jgi:hypothetical protein